MNIGKLSMQYRTVVITVIALLTVWGSITFMTMPRREDPQFTIRTCVVATAWPGAPAIKVEELITDKIETALDGLEEVEKLESTTINGLSTVYVNLTDDVPVDAIQNVWDKVRAKVDLVTMPTDKVRPVVNDDFGSTAVMLLAIYQTPLPGQAEVDERVRYSPRELEIFAERVQDSARLLPGVAEVELYGVRDEAIYIETDLGNWAQIELTTDQLRNLVEQRNIVSPGGSIDTAAGRFNVKPGGEFDAVNEIESIAVGAVQTGRTASPVRLRDIGLSVHRDYEDPASVICRYSDTTGTYPAVTLAITMKAGGNIIEVCNACVEKYERLVNVEQLLPADLAITPVSLQADNVNAKVNDVINNVISAIVIVVIVVFLFVGARTSIVMAANIPIVVLAAIAIIRWFGVEIEQISLASIIIALGLLVDNAVQVCDQTRTNVMDGMTPAEGAMEAANTLMFPMLAGTLTTVAAFFPMLLALKGGGAEYVYSLPVTLSTTLLVSWLFAMTICVILAAAFIRAPKDPNVPTAPLPWLGYEMAKVGQRIARMFHRKNSDSDAIEADGSNSVTDTNDNDSPGENIFLRLYGVAAHLAVKFKWPVVLGTIGLLFATVQLPVSTEFFPQDRRDQFYINISLPETSTIEQTNQVVKQVESTIRTLSQSTNADGEPIERLRAMRSMVGGGGSRWALGLNPQSPASNVAEILIRTTDGEVTAGFIADIRRVADEGDQDLGLKPITGARVVPKSLSLGPPAEPVVIRVSGDGFANMQDLRRVTNEVKQLVREQEGTWDVHDSWGVYGFQLTLDIDDEKANLAGVSNADVADTLNAYYSGLRLSTFREGDHSVPVYFRLAADQRNDLSGIDRAYVEGQNGKLPLNSIATTRPVRTPVKIERRDMNRTIEVKAEVEDGISGNDVVNAIMNSEAMAKIRANLPTGFTIEVGGSLEESQDASVQMGTSFLISFLVIVLILVVMYNGWSKTLVILATLPMAVIGAWYGLYLTSNPLGFMPQLGLLSLFGIVLNTGIIFIEFADILIKQKVSEGDGSGPISGITRAEFRQCLVEAGKQRMLPIFLTTATTVGGLFPLALSGGPLWEGLAWLMIFGLLVATLLTLFVVPALYAIVVETFRINPIGKSDA
ncbi:efflux RND transporter permease subunit [Mariniblastus fucicola]|uniref:Toluene efflux pump membrane transporter TtgH n=1 Tax=Mariniblastus fucicola TaxID=980251 RepID=A0A5B9PC90_9BACT|nr:efflux RND transporter permease subunit [Mariniblastus fucicola]QEG22670.1 Toluene efflux pump membrane transporter TtgH [Mariniblastus fucicola]